MKAEAPAVSERTRGEILAAREKRRSERHARALRAQARLQTAQVSAWGGWGRQVQLRL